MYFPVLAARSTPLAATASFLKHRNKGGGMEQKHTPGPWYAVPNNSFIDITTAPGVMAEKLSPTRVQVVTASITETAFTVRQPLLTRSSSQQRLNYWKPAFVPAVTCLTQGTSRRKGR